ncbi:uncharacterized protein TM35_000342380 [Trypanosoma theileri]|uniref:Flagellum targeting protein kharon1 n=1 Tax=Trypanosoma theileri TaxID=67003 RepID=A0A1X0NLN4_9TRYP|nr:uncharacterized protein TM35_000342380 [Trypanosoma theileri]ORC85626.1 hypothetical protein TM35_000342380 [Trypanosoma theileri]
MAAAAVERPTTAQERVLASNNPPPPPKVNTEPSHRQRAAAHNRGAGVAGYFAGKPPAQQEAPQQSRKVLEHSPSEFLAGPKEPGHVKHGVRRYEDRNVSTVGKALTEEWILGRGEDDEEARHHHGRHRGPKDNLEGLCCSVKTEEAKPRKLRASGHAPPPSTMAPYSEPELPPQYVEPPHQTGRRRFKSHSSGDIIARVLPTDANEETTGPRSRFHRNRANESVDVLNLGQYTREQLHEVERKVVKGPRQFTPAPIPPRPRPTIARVKTHANETHDIFGTGRGTEDAEPVHRKNPGASAPRRTGGANIFDTTPETQKPPKPYRPSDLLSYDDGRAQLKARQQAAEKAAAERAAAEKAAQEKPRAQADAASRQPQGKVESGMLFVSKSDSVEPRGGRAPGMYAPKHGTRNIY